ncbi:MAG: hypothetical protein IPJ88_06010 [Myxococcales bacterium]|nr:MAG: hypothetical protein IPJ88_06010 [Myxococcales bacterium]
MKIKHFFVLRALAATLSFGIGSTAYAEQCPNDQPSWIRGRAVYNEQGVSRTLGEVYVYAYERGQSTANTRYIAVTDNDGYLCIHDTGYGEWVVTVYEPFTFRPIVRELNCSASACDLGDLHLDTALRISDDHLGYDGNWWGGSFAQTVLMPEDSLSLVKVSFRDGAAQNPISIQVFEGQQATGTPIGSAGLRVLSLSNRDSAVFQPGEVLVNPGELYTFVGSGGWAPWRDTGDRYPSGQGFSVDGNGALSELSNQDIALNLDIDGPDGNLTSMYVHYNDSAEGGSDFAQSFIARSASITHASVFVGGGSGLRRIQAFISATKDGPAIGPIKESKGLPEQGVAFAWFANEVPTVVGQTYFLRIHYPTGSFSLYTRRQVPRSDPNATSQTESDAYKAGELWVNGGLAQGDLSGRILGPAPEQSSSSQSDAGSTTDNDAQIGADASLNDAAPTGNAQGGCSCNTVQGQTSPTILFLLCLALILSQKQKKSPPSR